MKAFYLTHPQVEIEPERPVPEWRLSDGGRQRVDAMLGKTWLRSVGCIVSSAELKAVETAALIAAYLRVAVEIDPEMGENDRSATGFLQPDEFEAAADRFFAEPDKSWQGWERAVDAADRIETAVRRVLDRPQPVPTLLVGHGGVGTLLKCRIGGRPISRREDQPAGGGNLFAFGIASFELLCDWTPMETFEGVDHAG
ncbi:histidine phosphatase family protein [Chelativorans salis]|uniref:Phosphoglycerate mutase family protein n=1 Tax=Chelativorans salis TaxID=2978478 RepID=A0ABT2LVJ8_9HYPH|nr:histidine phosphatase family protein [Chelativorans sp. EGI FJ00035]MCT7378534.1 phosphoglycerate mutase family protein [Chelativorans sp. EGI FJ00035]